MRQAPRPLSTDCPTPQKSRFATQEGALAAAREAELVLHKTLYPYDTCPCGWVHLTSKKSRVNKVPTLTGLAAYSPETFARVVTDDVRQIAHPDDVAALRHPENLHRWRAQLQQLQKDVQKQLAAKAGERGDDVTEWRRRINVFRLSVASALDECTSLISQQRVENAKKRRAAKELRHDAGEKAIDRLVNAHQKEFQHYLAEECEALGVELPMRIHRHMELDKLKAEKET